MPYKLWAFIELAPFARAREAYGMDDAEFSELQAALLGDPEAGEVIPRSGGCRKMRWHAQGRGKRGGYRVIYFLRTAAGAIVMVTLYAKNVRDNIEASVLKKLREVYEHGEDDD